MRLSRLVVKEVRRPRWARRPIVDKEGAEGRAAFRAFAPHWKAIRQHIHKEWERTVNDPEMVFLSEEEGFPVKSELSGKYYYSDRSYGCRSFRGRDCYELVVMVHCLGAQVPADDYLGLEMRVYLWKDTGDLEFEPEFQSEAI